MTDTKTLTGHLVVNWQDGKMRYRKTAPNKSKQSPYEFVVPIEIDVRVPDKPSPKVEATVDVPEVAVQAGLRADDAQHVDPEAWQPVADGLIDQHVRDGGEASFEAVYELTGRVMNDVETYPDPSAVKSYIGSELTKAVREQRDVATA